MHCSLVGLASGCYQGSGLRDMQGKCQLALQLQNQNSEDSAFAIETRRGYVYSAIIPNEGPGAYIYIYIFILLYV